MILYYRRGGAPTAGFKAFPQRKKTLDETLNHFT